ncbi:hypothetical protein MCG98_00780 [Ruminococcus sp. OA3]|uniref:hypothetical protein n=1 Tax=Ruminococcus sp. OA3 TaxID=2914164 RepID=UPI001F05B191|nr:hypothetical protein [Ruminococcus sp. OA3]MCH1981109.1 hypothetical protein [Ruminococcus sp. OA3]
MEAAFAVPVFFLALVLLISLMDMMRVHTRVTLSLNQSAKELGMYGYAAEKALGESPVGKLEGAVCAAYAASKLPKEARTEVSLTGSSYRKHTVELRAAGVYRFPVSFFGISRVKFQAAARVHAWTGYRAEEDEHSGKTEEMVYVADRRTVYHTYGDCSHLQLTIVCTNARRVRDQRNESGGKYHACPYCTGNKGDTVLYITPQGDRYHAELSCSALRRTGRLVKKSEVEDLSVCSRCAARGA